MSRRRLEQSQPAGWTSDLETRDGAVPSPVGPIHIVIELGDGHRYVELARQLAMQDRHDIILFPETALPYRFNITGRLPLQRQITPDGIEPDFDNLLAQFSGETHPETRRRALDVG